MKNRGLQLLFAGLILCAALPVLAGEKAGDEKKLDRSAVEMDKDAGQPGGEAVEEKLKSEFKVDDARVQGLRALKLGYGEISIVLALAQGLPGGITDANVQKVTALRQGPPVMGWGKVAGELGLKLGPVISKVKKISAETRKRVKAEKARMDGQHGHERGGKNMRPEKQEKMGVPEIKGPH